MIYPLQNEVSVRLPVYGGIGPGKHEALTAGSRAGNCRTAVRPVVV
jgi:hypothetical protein